MIAVVGTCKGHKAQVKLTQPFLQGQLPIFSIQLQKITLLDSPDQLDYDAACTMILNLE
jgi:hypothetical protein